MANASCRTHSSAIADSSSRENTFPVGLFGEFTTIARVRIENAARSSPSSNVQSGGRSVTSRGTAPDRIASGP